MKHYFTPVVSQSKRCTLAPLVLVCWSIWQELFEAQEKNVARLVSEIKDEAGLWGHGGSKAPYPLC
jgi:hypothetical protein